MKTGMDRLAEMLEVDEVVASHGPKGYALQVRVEKSWLATIVDHEELEDVHGHRQVRVLGERLAYLADTLRRNLGKSGRRIIGLADGATRAAYDAEEAYRTRRSYQPVSVPPLDAEPVPPAPAESLRMGSRFEAIVAELKNL